MKKIHLCGLFFLIAMFLCSCSSDSAPAESISSAEKAELLYESQVSPNEAFVEDEAEVVVYTIQVFQDENHVITVKAASNSAFFQDTQYEIPYSSQISESDIAVTWTTIMGDPEPSEEDQFAVADISISSNGEVISQRKINFFRGGMEIITDAINQNKE